MEYIVRKQFALDSSVYNVDDIVEIDEAEAKSLVEDGKLEKYVEEKTLSVEVDTKSISNAIADGFARFAPKPVEETKSMDFGDFLQAIAKKEIDVDKIDHKTINITTGNQGEAATTILTETNGADILAESGVARRLNVINLSGTNNVYKFNVLSGMGNAPAVVAESGTVGASQPVLTTFTLTLEKVQYHYLATDEAMEDTGALVGEINSQVGPEFAKFIENGAVNGVGTVLVGVVGHAQTTSVAKETGQTADTIVVENIDKMYSSAKNPARSVWLMSRSAYTAIQGLEDSNGNRLFQGPNQLGDAPFGTLKGLPIAVSDYCQEIGTVGDIVLGDWSKYRLAVKGGLQVASSEHVKFLESETAYKFTYRMAGTPVGIKQTATDGTTISDFVTLANRA